MGSGRLVDNIEVDKMGRGGWERDGEQRIGRRNEVEWEWDEVRRGVVGKGLAWVGALN